MRLPGYCQKLRDREIEGSMRIHWFAVSAGVLILASAPGPLAAKDKVLKFIIRFATITAEGKEVRGQEPVLVTTEGRPACCSTSGRDWARRPGARVLMLEVGKTQVIAYPTADGRYTLQIELEDSVLVDKKKERMKVQHHFTTILRDGESYTVRIDTPGQDKPIWWTITASVKKD